MFIEERHVNLRNVNSYFWTPCGGLAGRILVCMNIYNNVAMWKAQDQNKLRALFTYDFHFLLYTFGWKLILVKLYHISTILDNVWKGLFDSTLSFSIIQVGIKIKEYFSIYLYIS